MNDLRQIKQRWMAVAPQQWWGDSIDVRFHLIAQLRTLRHQTVLDVGCNIGMMLTELDASNRKYGFDLNVAVLKRAQELNPTAVVLRSSLFAGFPFQTECFEAVIMANVMPYHEVLDTTLDKAEQKTRVFQEIYRILKPGGKLFLTTPNGAHFCYLNSRKIRLAELQHALARFRQIDIYGWNPLPPLVCFLPPNLQKRIPPRYHKYLFLPSPLLARIPGIMPVLRKFMTKKGLLKRAKAFYVECEK